MQITDRSKDVIKSGGEWISSVELENAAVGCAGVAEAAAIGVKHPKWDERPLLLVVRKEGSEVSKDEILAHLDGPCRQMVAARRDPVRRQPAPHRDRQAAQDRACASNIATTRSPSPEEARGHHIFTSARYRGGMNSMGRIEVARRPGCAARARRRARAGRGRRPPRPHDVIDSLAADWTALAAEASEPNPFAEHWFVAASLRTLAGTATSACSRSAAAAG